jgi:hypothetical protein
MNFSGDFFANTSGMYLKHNAKIKTTYIVVFERLINFWGGNFVKFCCLEEISHQHAAQIRKNYFCVAWIQFFLKMHF